MRQTDGRMTGRRGFTLIELVLAMTLLGSVLVIALPRFNDSRQTLDMNRAVRTVALDLDQALSMAARQRTAVEIVQPEGTLSLVVRNAQDGTEYLARDFGDGSTAVLSDFELTPALVTVFPTGRTSSQLTVVLATEADTQTVTMSLAGQVRVVP